MTNIAEIKALKERVPDIAYAYSYTALSPIGGRNASRGIMHANNSKQTVLMEDPEPPRFLAGCENSIGKLCKAYKQVEGEWEVLEKIRKYSDGDIYCIALYNKATNTVDVFERPIVEDGPERFGFSYNASNMDSKNVGDIIHDGEVLYKSTSYDDDMNYNMGINARTALMTGVCTLEDGIVIGSSFQKRVKLTEATSFPVSINDNDIPLPIHEYDGSRHVIPKIGQPFKSDVIIATRKKNKRKIAFDFTDQAIINSRQTDTQYRAGAGSVIYDIDIHYNAKVPFPDDEFHKEIKMYYDEQTAYYTKIYEMCENFKALGYNRTSNTSMIHKRAKDYVSVDAGEYKWKGKERVFSNIEITFKCKRQTSLHEGYKLVGRHGDKGVISEIRDKDHGTDYAYTPTEELDKLVAKALGIEYSPKLKISVRDDKHMPYDEYGRRIDVLQNASGGYRRENTEQLTEIGITFIAESIQDEVRRIALGGVDDRLIDPMKGPDPNRVVKTGEEIVKDITDKDMDSAFDLICDFMTEMDDGQYQLFMSFYHIKLDKNMKHTASKKAKKYVISTVIDQGFYIRKLPNSDLRFDKICRLYDKYSFIKRRTMYVEKFGIVHKVVTPMVVGFKYLYALKQTSNKNFSARHIGKINKIGCPTKSTDKKENRANISDTPINRGETYNLFASLHASLLMTSDIYTKNSPIARRDLKDILTASGDPYQVRTWKVKNTYKNNNVLNFKARLKIMGITYDLVTNKTIRFNNLRDYKTFINVYSYSFFDYARNACYYKFLIDKFNLVMRTGTNDQKENIWSTIMQMDEYKQVDPPRDVLNTVMNTMNALIVSSEDEPEEHPEAM